VYNRDRPVNDLGHAADTKPPAQEAMPACWAGMPAIAATATNTMPTNAHFATDLLPGMLVLGFGVP
jgi:hypothetical protein